jgi:hypothetical protein
MGVGICKTEILCAARFIPLWSLVLLVILFKSLRNVLRRATMASLTKFSSRTLGTLLVVSAGAAAVAGARRVDYKSLKTLLQSTLTGPGSTSRIIAILVVLVNFKNFPLVWHVGTPAVTLM